MMIHVFISAVVLSGYIAQAGEDYPAANHPNGRLIEGKVFSHNHIPISNAKIYFAEAGTGFTFVDDAVAQSDINGCYKIDLSKLPWSKNPLRAMALAPGYSLANQLVEPLSTSVDFNLVSSPWKKTLVNLQTPSGNAVSGVDISIKIGRATWQHLISDIKGQVFFEMAPELWVHISAKPPGARPVSLTLSVTKEGPETIRLPVLSPIRGRILDNEDRPLPNATIGRWVEFWGPGDAEMLPFPTGARSTTDSNGNFEISPEVVIRQENVENPPVSPTPSLLCFADASFRRISYRLFNPFIETPPISINFAPTRHVHANITPGAIAPGVEVGYSSTISIEPISDKPSPKYTLIRRSWPFLPGSDHTSVEEYLPSGKYNLEVTLERSRDGGVIGHLDQDLIVPTGNADLNLGSFELEPTPLKKMIGGAAPDFEAIDLQSGRRIHLADFRGKVVVIDFWGYWCGPCVGNMPKLIDMHQKFAGRPLEVLALHDSSIKTHDEYNQKIISARRQFWENRDLPFRVLLDLPAPGELEDPKGTGATISRYNVHAFPTLFVINPRGDVVDVGSPASMDRLTTLIESLVDQAERGQ